MTATMGPPPPRNPNPSTEPESIAQEESEPRTAKTTMGPPPPLPINPNPSTEPESIAPEESELIKAKTTMSPPPPLPINPNLQNPLDEEEPSNSKSEPNSTEKPLNPKQSSVPYTIPPWSGPPCHHFFLEVLKDGCILDRFKVFEKGAYMFGRIDLCDFVLEHPTISRFHAVLQFRSSGEAYLYDLGSTHGTFINKSQVTKKTYVDLRVGDVIRFGHSTRLYIFQGPSELMPPEKDLKVIREAKIREEMLDREASLRRARAEASLSDGISWGMEEDAIEEAEVVENYKDFAFLDYARVGRALALYEVGDKEEAFAEMEDVSISLKGYPGETFCLWQGFLFNSHFKTFSTLCWDKVSLSAFAFLFSELVQYNQTRVDNIAELERRY